MSGNYDEERAERAFKDYYGADTWQSWKSHYGERPYSTYWSLSEHEKEAVKEELGVAAEQREAFAKAEQSIATVRSLVADSGYSGKEAHELVNNVLRNLFRGEPVKAKDLREGLFWKERLNDHVDSIPPGHEKPKYEGPDELVFVDLENDKVDISDRLNHLVVPVIGKVKASDLRAEAVGAKFSEWREVVHEILLEERQNFERDDFEQEDFERNHTTEMTDRVGVEVDIERLLFGDESANSLSQVKEEQQLDDRLGLRPKEEREDDERSR